MTIAKAVIYNGGLQQQIMPGDVLAAAEVIPATIVTNAITISAVILAAGFIQRTVTGAGTDTIDSAANIITGITSGFGLVGIQNGTTWRVKWLNNAAFVITVQATANTGVTVVNGTINASSVKEFIVTIVNGTPAATVTGNTTNASAVITGMDTTETGILSAGMIVTNAINGLQGTTILSVQPGVGVTLSGNANATSTTQVGINFSPVITVTGIGQGLL